MDNMEIETAHHYTHNYLLLLSSLLEFLRLVAELFFSLSLLFLSFSEAALDERDLLPPRAIF